MRKAVFLDRDGVLNASLLVQGIPTPPKTPDDVIILNGVIEAIHLLKINRFIPVIITNQPDIARGKTTRNQVEAINAHICNLTGINHLYVCCHDDSDGCNCRKPKPGLLYQAAAELGISLSESFLVGDRWKDISAGLSAGVKCFYIDYSYGERKPDQPFTGVSSLLEVVNLVIGE